MNLENTRFMQWANETWEKLRARFECTTVFGCNNFRGMESRLQPARFTYIPKRSNSDTLLDHQRFHRLKPGLHTPGAHDTTRRLLRSGANDRAASKSLGVALLVIFTASAPVSAATNDLTSALQKGLFEEEANHNYAAAMAAYESVISRFDENRKLAATAIFRLGEIYRKQARTNEAAAQYQRIIGEFADQAQLADLSRQTLASLGNSPRTETAATGLAKPEAEAALAASQAEEFERIRNLIKNSPDLINAPAAYGYGVTLLQSAAAQGKTAIATMLIEDGAAVDGVKSGGLTPLHFAAGNGHKAMVELLLSKGAKPGAENSEGLTPLHLAVAKGYEAVAKTLIDAGAPVNAMLGKKPEGVNFVNILSYSINTEGTPLHAAVDSGYASTVSLLILNKADVNAEAGGRTALTLAVEKNYGPIVHILLEAKANPNAGAVDLPLDSAIVFDRPIAMIQSLLEHGADAKKVGRMGSHLWAGQTDYFPMELAVFKRNVEAIKLLLQAKADPNSRSQGKPLIFSALSDSATLEALLGGGANPNVRDEQSRDEDTTPLHEAANSGNEKQVDLLIAHGAEVNAQTKNGTTPLSKAAGRGSTNVVAVLLKAGAVIDAVDKFGNTPLDVAVYSRQPEVVRLLLEKGADPNHRGRNGGTVLDAAKEVARRYGLDDRGLPRGIPTPGRPAASISGAQAPRPDKVVIDLLHQFGAVEDLPKFDRIEIRRRSANFSVDVFSKDDNDWNQFTLTEAISKQYQLLTTQSFGNWAVGRDAPSNLFGQSHVPFPDFDHLVIHRPAADGKSWGKPINVSLRELLDSGDCSRDQQLQWGDIIEIPEADHPVADIWQGLTSAAAENLIKCVSRSLNVVVKGTNTQVKLSPEHTDASSFGAFNMRQYRLLSASFMIRSVLDQFKLIRFSSDLTHVKVKRHDATTGKNLEWTLDCSDTGHAAAFWLRDGDTIEIPDRT
jgi:ankyrin repeat protein